MYQTSPIPHLGYNREYRDHDACSSNPCKCSPKDENLHTLRETADKRADLKQEDTGNKHNLGRDNGEELAAGEHEAHLSEEVRCDDPGDLIQPIELRDNLRDSGRDNGLRDINEVASARRKGVDAHCEKRLTLSSATRKTEQSRPLMKVVSSSRTHATATYAYISPNFLPSIYRSASTPSAGVRSGTGSRPPLVATTIFSSVEGGGGDEDIGVSCGVHRVRVSSRGGGTAIQLLLVVSNILSS